MLHIITWQQVNTPLLLGCGKFWGLEFSNLISVWYTIFWSKVLSRVEN